MSLKPKHAIPLVFHLMLILLSWQGYVTAAPASIKAVLFYPPLCSECSTLIDDFLVPLTQTESEKLTLFPVDITEPPGNELFAQVVDRFKANTDTWDRPTLLIGGTLLQGASEITSRLPEILAGKGSAKLMAWPDLPGLQSLIQGDPVSAPTTDDEGSDSLATGLAWSVMAFLLLSLGLTAWRLLATERTRWAECSMRSWVLPLFALIGLGIGIYLSAVTLSNQEVMCGPIGDCMGVQLSPHSRMFSIPMSVWGVVFYFGILLLWLTQGRMEAPWGRRACLGLLAFSIFGVVFSVYLTGLELFVIHAVCVWCLTSAILTSLIMTTVMLKITSDCGSCA